MDENGNFFTDKEIESLKDENKQLLNRLNAKRYKMIDKVVDGVYKVIPRVNLKKKKAAMRKPARNVDRSFKKDRVDIINHNFYDWAGKTLYKGGAERYVYDLAVLLQSMGYQPRILQGAKKQFEKTYRGIPVIGVAAGVKPGDYKGLSKKYNEFCVEAEFVIASPNELACNITSVPCIGINHGVNFDGLWTSTTFTPVEQYAMQTNSIINATYCVCVDTNYINWMRTKDYKLSQKLVYIPNYYNKKDFAKRDKKHSDKIVFVYPRRIYEPRGYDITLKAFRKILKNYKNVELRFVGQIDSEKVRKDVNAFLEEFPNNFSHCEYSMEDAHKAYDGADVILVPTRYSEGTSLSCIEGQASGLPVIATNVGGLPNIILDHYNGLLISPNARSLERAVIELIENPSLRKELAKHSIDVAQSAFEKHLWDQRWRDVIEDFSKSIS